MKSKTRTSFAFIKSTIVHSFRMLTSNWIRTLLFSGGMTVCVILLTFVSLMGVSSYDKIQDNFSCWPKNALLLKGNINNIDIDRCLEGQSDLHANQFYLSSFEFNQEISVQEIGVQSNFLTSYLLEGDLQGIYTSEILYGREFNSTELCGFESAVMINESSALLLFGKANCLSNILTIGTKNNTKQYKIIGVLKDSYHSANQYTSFIDSSDSKKEITIAAYTPMANCQKKQNGTFDSVILYSKKETSLVSFSKSDMLKQYFANSTYQSFCFDNIQKNYDQSMESFYKIYIPFSIILIAAELILALVFFFFSVKERVNEIGIRKAVGANNSHILFQFMIENFILSLLVSFLGSLIGTISFGIYLLTFELGHAFIFSSISFTTILLVFFFNIAFMTMISVIPGMISRKIKIVDALRFE